MKILCCQLHSNEKISGFKEFVEEEDLIEQTLNSFNIIEQLNPDLVIYPELCYVKSQEDKYRQLSEGRIIIAGSYYDESDRNVTMIFHDRFLTILPKIYPSPYEPMFLTKIETPYPYEVVKKWEDDIINGIIPDYFIKDINSKYIVILNCMDYYKLGYYIARSEILKDKISLLVCPCSSNNLRVFTEESNAIHNHNPYIYSIIVNCFAKLGEKPYSIGNSYIYGLMDVATKTYLKEIMSNISFNDNPSSLIKVNDEKVAIYIELEDNFKILKGSDDYKKNPKNIEIFNL